MSYADYPAKSPADLGYVLQRLRRFHSMHEGVLLFVVQALACPSGEDNLKVELQTRRKLDANGPHPTGMPLRERLLLSVHGVHSVHKCPPRERLPVNGYAKRT